MKQKYNGFTLIELMVSVALMLIIIGMTMVIFNSTSTTFTVAEAKVDIMQNARLALDTIAKDIANATEISGNSLTSNPSPNPDYTQPNYNNHCLQITTVTNWMDGATKVTNKARVAYRIEEFSPGTGLYQLHRIIYPKNNNNDNYQNTSIDNSILAEYLIAPNTADSQAAQVNQPLYFEYVMHSGTINTNWAESGGLLGYTEATELPPLVRVTITVTDEFRTACRTLSRMIWIPKGIRRP